MPGFRWREVGLLCFVDSLIFLGAGRVGPNFFFKPVNVGLVRSGFCNLPQKSRYLLMIYPHFCRAKYPSKAKLSVSKIFLIFPLAFAKVDNLGVYI